MKKKTGLRLLAILIGVSLCVGLTLLLNPERSLLQKSKKIVENGVGRYFWIDSSHLMAESIRPDKAFKWQANWRQIDIAMNQQTQMEPLNKKLVSSSLFDQAKLLSGEKWITNLDVKLGFQRYSDTKRLLNVNTGQSLEIEGQFSSVELSSDGNLAYINPNGKPSQLKFYSFPALKLIETIPFAPDSPLNNRRILYHKFAKDGRIISWNQIETIRDKGLTKSGKPIYNSANYMEVYESSVHNHLLQTKTHTINFTNGAPDFIDSGNFSPGRKSHCLV